MVSIFFEEGKEVQTDEKQNVVSLALKNWVTDKLNSISTPAEKKQREVDPDEAENEGNLSQNFLNTWVSLASDMDEARVQIEKFGEVLNKVKLNEHKLNAQALIKSTESLVKLIKKTFSID